MPDVPQEMMTKGRQPDQVFSPDESLFRRFRPSDFVGYEIAPEAFELPDMSVIRQKFGKPEWLLIQEEYQDWGVAGFKVEDIPANEEVHHLGYIEYVLRPEHAPDKYNYPHSEVRIYRDGVHICRASDNLYLMEPDFHLRWRYRLSLASRVTIRPSSR